MAITEMVCESEGDLHHTSPKKRPMTTSFINETTVDQELQLADLQQINGASPVAVAFVAGIYAGGAILLGTAIAMKAFEDEIKEAVDSLTGSDTEDKDSSGCSGCGDTEGGSAGYRDPGRGRGQRGLKPVLY